jgi:Flp pilus assembly protein TadD
MRYIAAFTLLSLLQACSAGMGARPDLAAISPLYQHPGAPDAAEASHSVATPDLLAMSPEMKSFVDRYVRPAPTHRSRLRMLHSSLRSNALLDIDYDPAADGTAQEVFERGTANCLSYAHLFVAMARYAGLDAEYHLLKLRPEWSRHGDQIALRQHVNVLVKLDRRQHYMVDIDPVRRAEIADSSTIADEVAVGLHHSNLAMTQLFQGNLEPAYLQSVRALELSPNTDFLWINLGAIYSNAGNDSASEQAYRTALALNPHSPSAMNNLMILSERHGDTQMADYWESQITGHRQRNPYYHAYLGEQAQERGEFQQARRHFQAAIKRKQDDADLYYRLGKVYLDLDEPAQAIEYLQLAVDTARLVTQREEYQALLDQLVGQSVASLL